jgi:hypothetical protein
MVVIRRGAVTLEIGGLQAAEVPGGGSRRIRRARRELREARYDGAHTGLWAHATDREHVMLAEAFLEFSGARFTRPAAFTLFQGPQGLEWQEGGGIGGGAPDVNGGEAGGLRCAEGAAAGPLSPEHLRSVPVHLVLAYRDAVPPIHLASPPFPPPPPAPAKTGDDIRFDEAGRPHCPYCDERMGRYSPPVTVFEIDYGVEELYVCFNDGCEYYRGSRRCMRSQVRPLMFHAESGRRRRPLPDDLWGGLRSCRSTERRENRDRDLEAALLRGARLPRPLSDRTARSRSPSPGPAS